MLEEVLSKEALHGVAMVGRKDTEGMEDMVGIDGTVMGTGEAIAIPRATIISIVSFPVICHTYSTAQYYGYNSLCRQVFPVAQTLIYLIDSATFSL